MYINENYHKKTSSNHYSQQNIRIQIIFIYCTSTDAFKDESFTNIKAWELHPLFWVAEAKKRWIIVTVLYLYYDISFSYLLPSIHEEGTKISSFVRKLFIYVIPHRLAWLRLSFLWLARLLHIHTSKYSNLFWFSLIRSHARQTLISTESVKYSIAFINYDSFIIESSYLSDNSFMPFTQFNSFFRYSDYKTRTNHSGISPSYSWPPWYTHFSP